MAVDGIAPAARVDALTQRKLHAKVVDSILNSRTYFARLMGRGVPFMGKTYDVTHKISTTGQGQFFVGLETLNSSASNTYVTTSFAHTAYTIPAVSIMLESFANAGEYGVINLDANKLEEARAEAVQDLGSAIYGTGTANKPLGLEAIVDDGTNNLTIGGVTRSTYGDQLDAYVLASGGTMTLAKLATVFDGASAAGLESEEPNILVTTKTVWSLYEQLLAPQVRADYAAVGYNALALRGEGISKVSDLKGAAGFTVLSYRGRPVLKDDACTSGVVYMLNERYFKWMGRTVVPDEYRGMIEKVTLGEPKTLEGVAAANEYMPSQFNGFFATPYMMIPNQAGMIARYYVIGQLVPTQIRRSGKLTGVTGV